MKIPIAIVQKLNVRLIVYLDDILLMASTVEEILMARDTLIFLFQNLGFLIKVKKSQFHPVQHLEFLGGQCKFDKDGIDFAIRKSEQNNLPMQGHSESRSSIDPPTDKTSREINIDYSGSSSSSSSLQTHSERPNKKSPYKQVVPNLCCSVNESEGGAKLVDGELESLQWQITPLNPSESDNKFRCFKDRLGSSMSRNVN